MTFFRVSGTRGKSEFSRKSFCVAPVVFAKESIHSNIFSFPAEEGFEGCAEVGGVGGGGEGPPGEDDGVLVRGEREPKPEGGSHATLVFLGSLTFPFPPLLMAEVVAQMATGPCRRALCLLSAAPRGPMFSRTYVFSGDM